MSYHATGDWFGDKAAQIVAAEQQRTGDHRCRGCSPEFRAKVRQAERDLVAKRLASSRQKIAERDAATAQVDAAAEETGSTRKLLYIGGAVGVAAILIIMLKKKKGSTTP